MNERARVKGGTRGQQEQQTRKGGRERESAKGFLGGQTPEQLSLSPGYPGLQYRQAEALALEIYST